MKKNSEYIIERFPLEREGYPGSYTLVHTPEDPARGISELNMIYRPEYRNHPRLDGLWKSLKVDSVFVKPFWLFCDPLTVLKKRKEVGIRSLLYLVLKSVETTDSLMLMHLGMWDNHRSDHNNIWRSDIYDKRGQV